MDLIQTCKIIRECKEQERMLADQRRNAEDKLLSLLGVSDQQEGTQNFNLDGPYKVKVVGKINRKVDADEVERIANEHGLQAHTQALFRWKAELNKPAWSKTDPSITGPFAAAIEAKPGRPTITIDEKE